MFPSLLNDIIFKLVFGSPNSEPVLRALINALLSLEGDKRIVSLEILNPELPKEHWKDRGAILDVRAKDGTGRLYNMEVQLASHKAYAARVIYYISRLYSGQLTPGDHYGSLKKTIGISLLDFNMFPEVETLHTTFQFYDRRNSLLLSDIVELHFIELAKFNSDKPHALRTPFEKWLHLLKFSDLYNVEKGSVPDTLRQEEGIEMAIESMRQASASQQVRELVEARLKAMHDEATRLHEAEERGLERGLERGREEGREEGLEEGLEEGRRRTQQENARRMLSQGFPLETIRLITGLSEDELAILGD